MCQKALTYYIEPERHGNNIKPTFLCGNSPFLRWKFSNANKRWGESFENNEVTNFFYTSIMVTKNVKWHRMNIQAFLLNCHNFELVAQRDGAHVARPKV